MSKYRADGLISSIFYQCGKDVKKAKRVQQRVWRQRQRKGRRR